MNLYEMITSCNGKIFGENFSVSCHRSREVILGGIVRVVRVINMIATQIELSKENNSSLEIELSNENGRSTGLVII